MIEQLVIRCLLHDIGKVCYRIKGREKHSQSGHDYLKHKLQITEQQILWQVLYHHKEELENADCPDDALAYICYIADNISSAIDRRKNESEHSGFDRTMPLESIFNLLNQNNDHNVYPYSILNQNEIIYPQSQTTHYTPQQYSECLRILGNALFGLPMDKAHIPMILDILEQTLSFVPSSTAKNEVADISLFDHVKTTAGIGCCILQYLQSQKITDYKTALFRQTQKFYRKKSFLLYHIDISGIQQFLYTITHDGALKTLRTHSFYIEILLEYIADILLERMGLTRTNILYMGGGHAYFLLGNTEENKTHIAEIEKQCNQFLMSHFGTKLYLASGMVCCSANDLMNRPDGAYRSLFYEVFYHVNERKLKRYQAEDILFLNRTPKQQILRECRICKCTIHNTRDICERCEQMQTFSQQMVEKSYFVVVNEKPKQPYLPLPMNGFLIAQNKQEFQNTKHTIAYCKNMWIQEPNISAKLWVGSYQKHKILNELAIAATGVPRLGVLRADVDDLGQAFVSGFEREGKQNQYVTLSRTATFSRKVSLFFKYHINRLLVEGCYQVYGQQTQKKERDIVIVYSGGDDVFVIGAWDDVLGFAIDFHQCLKAFTQNTLHISAGFGMYHAQQPVAIMAEETAKLTDVSKNTPHKNAITLFDQNTTYTWETLIQSVLGEKLRILNTFLKRNEQYGMSLIYRLLELVREISETNQIQIARFAYILGKLQPNNQKDLSSYEKFSQCIYSWIQNETDRKQLYTALCFYVYGNRE